MLPTPFHFPALDVPTLLTVYQMVATLMMLVTVGGAWGTRGRYGMWFWAGAFASVALAQLVRSWLLAVAPPSLLTMTVGHIGGVLSSVLVLLGVRAFLGLPLRWQPAALFAGLVALGSVSALTLGQPLWVSLSLTLSASALLRCFALRHIFRAWRVQGGFALSLMLLVLGLSVAAHALRALTSSPGFAGSSEHAVATNSVWLLVFIALLIAQAFAVLLLLNSELQRSLWSMIEIDPLTGLLNRRGLKNRVGRLRQRGAGDKAELGMVVAMIDFDHFKDINDRHGHAAGDAVLRGLGRLLLSHVRPNDLAVRMGGEEFAVVWQEVSAEDAVKLAERLRLSVADEIFSTEAGAIQCTVSIGIAMPRSQDEAVDDLLGRADAALYKAKREGRNRVERAY
ncbi:GGDEF domain-containing protein [Paucibacter sp. TC2R-5]|uniref:GGDEF domain-containing protein n=1 Tax=Paucibacter sp. TC2R-5 TaxID=2893555 RepID=UPI0021E49A99|nr:GGDEF domain-containing protein [Paucibacter sp. TC2R-5]MCV2358490.1 GGDEF domain-containing protein [Paucibacter sp. TC2R-5]